MWAQNPNQPICFNPRSHAGSDLRRLSCRSPMVTGFNPRSHAGSDKRRITTMTKLNSFNPRSHAGSDFVISVVLPGRCVSIHAPTRGATIRGDPGQDSLQGFQSTLPRGERLNASLLCSSVRMFQSTLPRGERREVRARVEDARQSFNPRSHAGSDRCVMPVRLAVTVSIHAPTRGATVIFIQS